MANSYHVRSISMPWISHPNVIKIEEQIQKLKACYNLKGLGQLYSFIHEFLNLPSTQQASTLSLCVENKWLESELERSVRLLDLCCAIKDTLFTVEEHVRDLQLAFRKSGEYYSAASEESIREQIFSKKETRNNINNCRSLLKRAERLCVSSCPTTTEKTSMVARVLTEAREVTISTLRFVLSSIPAPAKPNPSRWSFVSKAVNMRKGAGDGEYKSCICFKDVDTGLIECLFRQLIQNRVSLLNMLSL